ncbi:unnamed protein product [Auanema sp. JU1783]|nr:unnamed protein product [Auanema sp. JU1783]
MMNASIQTDYVKVIVSCLNYEHEGISRIVLQKALTSTSEVARRWCTRFVGALASLQLPDFGKWGMRLLLGQLADPCVKVVRHAIRLLHVWLPLYPEAVRYLRNINLDNFGEAGILLQAHIYSIEEFCSDDEEGCRNAISLWMTSLNERYIQMIDDEMRTSLLSVKRTLDGSFSRTSSERLEKFGIRCTIHLFGALARHTTGRRLLMELRIVKSLMNNLEDDEESYKVKGALIALGHIGGAENGISLFMSSTLAKILKLCEESPVLSIRGTAFWALNILGASVGGASALAKFGWESNRHRSVIEEVQLETERSDRVTDLRKGTITPNIPEIISEEVTFTPSHVNKTRSRSNSDIASCVYSPGRVGLHKSRSETALSTLLEPSYSSMESISVEAGARNERTLTGESAVTSALSSMIDDSSTSRRRATTTGSLGDEWETRSRSSTVAPYVSYTIGNERRVDIDPLSDVKVEPHFSTRLREKHRLAPMPLRRCLQVNRNIGDPVCYFFMTDAEEQSLSLYRHAVMEDTVTYPVLEWQSSQSEKVSPNMVNFHITALPIDVDVMCMNIFSPRSYHASIISEMEDRGAKSGHGGRSQRTDADLTHSALRCFYCSANTEKYPLPTDVDVARLRRHVLNHVDMLEIKEIGPEKHLLSLRAAHSWLFEWPCLYADVLELLDEYRFKARSRAFLQEIFYNALKL